MANIDEYEAPEGAVWVCNACGKRSKHRTHGTEGLSMGWDSSCFTWAVLCSESSIEVDRVTGRITRAVVFGLISNVRVSAKVVV